MCLQDQGIGNNDGGVARVRRALRLINNGGGVRRGQGIDNASEGSETTIETERIWGRQQRLRSRDERPEELTTTTEASEEKYDPKDLTTTDALAEEADAKTQLRERLQRRRRKCVYMIRVLKTTAVSSED